MPARLITIPISHFCEKARWALDRAGVAFTEEPHLQLVHVLAARRVGGGRTVPVLVTESGEILADSTAILRWTDTRLAEERRLYPQGQLGAEAAALEADLDAGLGPDSRLWLYHETLPVVSSLEPWALAGVPRAERRLFRFTHRLIDPAIRRYLGVDAATAAAALARTHAAFDDVATRLTDGRPYLLGERFTSADLTFASLAAPVLLPERYGSPLPPPEAMPAPLARAVREFRAHPAGRFAARLYREQRGGPGAGHAP